MRRLAKRLVLFIPYSKKVNRGSTGMREFSTLLAEEGYETGLMIWSEDKRPGKISFFQISPAGEIHHLPVKFIITESTLEVDKTLVNGSVPFNFSIKCRLTGQERDNPQLMELAGFIRRFFSLNTIRRPRLEKKIVMEIRFGNEPALKTDPRGKRVAEEIRFMPAEWFFHGGMDTALLTGFFEFPG